VATSKLSSVIRQYRNPSFKSHRLSRRSQRSPTVPRTPFGANCEVLEGRGVRPELRTSGRPFVREDHSARGALPFAGDPFEFAAYMLKILWAEHHCDTREASQLYGAWRKGSPAIRKRILDNPELFFENTATSARESSG
jgi:hypothetical protein